MGKAHVLLYDVNNRSLTKSQDEKQFKLIDKKSLKSFETYLGSSETLDTKK